MPDYDSKPITERPPIEETGSREAQAARRVMARYLGGIPRESFLRGNSDHSPIIRGIYDLAGASYMVLDALREADIPTDALGRALEVLEQVLEDNSVNGHTFPGGKIA